MSFETKLDEARQFAMNIRSDQNKTFLNIVECAHQEDLAARKDLQLKINAIVNELCTPPEELGFAPVVRLEKMILPVFEPVFSIASSLSPNEREPPPSPHDSYNQTTPMGFVNDSHTSPYRESPSVDRGRTQQKLSLSSGSTEFHTPPSAPGELASQYSSPVHQPLPRLSTPSRNRDSLTVSECNTQHQCQPPYNEGIVDIEKAEKGSPSKKEDPENSRLVLERPAGSNTQEPEECAIVTADQRSEKPTFKTSLSKSSLELSSEGLEKHKVNGLKADKFKTGASEVMEVNRKSESSGSDEESDADFNAESIYEESDDDYEESGDDYESSDDDYEKSDVEKEESKVVEPSRETISEVSEGNENREAVDNMMGVGSFSNKPEKIRTSGIQIEGELSNVDNSVQSSEDDTPVVKRRKSRESSRRSPVKARMSQSPENERKMVDIHEKNVSCSSKDVPRRDSVVKTNCSKEEGKPNSPISQSNLTKSAISEDAVGKSPPVSIEHCLGAEMQADELELVDLESEIAVRTSADEENDNRKCFPGRSSEPQSKPLDFNDESENESDIPGPQKSKSKPTQRSECQTEALQLKGILRPRKKSVSFREPPAGSPSSALGATVTLAPTGTNHDPVPTTVDSADNPYFKVGPDGKVDSSAIQKLFSIASAPSTSRNSTAITTPQHSLKTKNHVDPSTSDSLYHTQRAGLPGQPQKSFASNRVSFLSHAPGAQPPLPKSEVTPRTCRIEDSQSHGNTWDVSCELVKKTVGEPSSPITTKEGGKEGLLRTHDEGSQSMATPLASSSRVLDRLENSDSMDVSSQRVVPAAEQFKRDWSRMKQSASFDQPLGDYPRTEAPAKRRVIINDSARPKSEARRKIESIRAARLASQQKQAKSNQTSFVSHLPGAQGGKYNMQDSDPDENSSALLRSGASKVGSVTKEEVSSSNTVRMVAESAEAMSFPLETNSNFKTSDAILSSTSKPPTSTPSNMLLNLVSSVTSFLPTSASFSGMRMQKNKEASDDDEVEAALKRQKLDAERREAELHARREAMRHIKQKEAEEKQKRAEAKRRQIAAAERAKEEERQRREERRIRNKQMEEAEKKRRKQEEEKKRDERRKNVLNLKRKMEQERDLEVKRTKKGKDMVPQKSHLNKYDDAGAGESDMSSDGGDSSGMKMLANKLHRTRGAASSGPVSYDITPAKETILYDSDEEQKRRKGKVVPKWAAADKVMKSLQNQADPDELFASSTACNLTELFGQQRRYRTRSSSGNWARDRVTAQEEMAYKMATRGFDEKDVI